MGKDVQQPGGTTEKENAVTGMARQLRIDTERNTIRLHDGSKQGGHEIPNMELVTTLLLGGDSNVGNNVIQMFNSVAEMKNAQPALNIYAVLREDGIEDTFIWKPGAGDNGDIASDISGHWRRLGNEINTAISLWRSGMMAMQIGGTEPVADQTTTAWLSGNQLKLWDGTDYLDPTPALWMKLFAAIGGYYTGSASLPDRLAAQSVEVPNLDTVVESGWYKSKTDATGAPVAGVHSFDHRELTSAIAIQRFYPHNSATRNHWIRYRTAVTPTWTSWVEVLGSLPERLDSQSDPVVGDADTLTETGFYSLNSTSANLPAALLTSLIVIRVSATAMYQLAFTGSTGTPYRRVMNAGVWGAWGAFSMSGHNHDDRYYTESEVDALLAAKAPLVHNHDDRYYTESEVNALLADKAGWDTAWNGVGGVILAIHSGAPNIPPGTTTDGANLLSYYVQTPSGGGSTTGGIPGTWRCLGGLGNSPIGLWRRVN